MARSGCSANPPWTLRVKWGIEWTYSRVRKIREDAAAQRIQRAARAWLARRLVQRLREEELRSRATRSVAALNIQVGGVEDEACAYPAFSR